MSDDKRRKRPKRKKGAVRGKGPRPPSGAARGSKQGRRRLGRAQRSFLDPKAKGKRVSGDVAAGRAVELVGPAEVSAGLVAALRAGGEIDRYTHRFHSYPARLHPDAAVKLLEVVEGARVLDPFCGGGTVLVEAMVAGRRAFGRDLSPVAALVATARTRTLSKGMQVALKKASQRVEEAAEAVRGKVDVPPAVRPLTEWYEAAAVRELSALHAALAVEPNEGLRFLLRAIHSSLVVKYSRRASETSARMQRRPVGKGIVIKAFRRRRNELLGMFRNLNGALPQGAEAADVAWADARTLDLPCDAIITSPPYPGTYDYVPLQQLRLAWLQEEGDEEDLDVARKGEIGSRRDFRDTAETGYRSWERATEAWMGAAARNLSDGGKLAIVIGDGIAHGRLLETRKASIATAERVGLTTFAAASIERVDPGTQLAKREHALLFRKDPS